MHKKNLNCVVIRPICVIWLHQMSPSYSTFYTNYIVFLEYLASKMNVLNIRNDCKSVPLALLYTWSTSALWSTWEGKLHLFTQFSFGLGLKVKKLYYFIIKEVNPNRLASQYDKYMIGMTSHDAFSVLLIWCSIYLTLFLYGLRKSRFFIKVGYSACAPMYVKCRLLSIDRNRTHIWRHWL